MLDKFRLQFSSARRLCKCCQGAGQTCVIITSVTARGMAGDRLLRCANLSSAVTTTHKETWTEQWVLFNTHLSLEFICQIIEMDYFLLLFLTFVTTWHHFATRIFNLSKLEEGKYYSTHKNKTVLVGVGGSHLVSWQPLRATVRL